MLLSVIRNDTIGTMTPGRLLLNKSFFCYTLEDVIRAKPGQWKKEAKIYSNTAIPFGKYRVIVTFSNKFQRLLPEILNVPDFIGIRIHNGTTDKNTSGCILISYKRIYSVTGQLISLDNKKDAMNDLTQLLLIEEKKSKSFIEILKT